MSNDWVTLNGYTFRLSNIVYLQDRICRDYNTIHPQTYHKYIVLLTHGVSIDIKKDEYEILLQKVYNMHVVRGVPLELYRDKFPYTPDGYKITCDTNGGKQSETN